MTEEPSPRSVFISHTSDLASFPDGDPFVDAVVAAVNGSGDAPVDMRYFSATDAVPAEECARRVRACDIYVGVLGFTYGSVVPDDPANRSYTEFEFDIATEARIPRLMFFLGDDAPRPKLVAPDAQRQEAFRRRVSSEVVRVTSNSVAELKEQVGQALRDHRIAKLLTAHERLWGEVETSRRGANRSLEIIGGTAARSAASSAPSLAVPQRKVTSDRVRGRQELLRDLVDALTLTEPRSADSRVHVVHGLGGSGKTTVATEVARRALEDGVIVWWVPSVGDDGMDSALAAVAFAAGARESDFNRAHAADVLWSHLGGLTKRWLLVLDNIDDPTKLAPGDAPLAEGVGWLRPTSSPGMVLVTSRDSRVRRWAPWCVMHDLPVLDENNGAQILRDLAPEAGSATDAMALSKDLGGLPLALDLAGHYLQEAIEAPFPDRDSPTSFRSYRTALKGRLSEITADPAATGERSTKRAISTTWELSLKLLERQGIPSARPLLRLLSCFAVDPLPYRLVIDADLLNQSSLLGGADRLRVSDALQGLAGLNLVDLTVKRGENSDIESFITMHPLVRVTGRAGIQDNGEEDRFASLIALLLNRASGSLDPENFSTWTRWGVLAPHSDAAMRLMTSALAPEEAESATMPAFNAARYYHAAGMYNRARIIFEAVLSVRLKTLGPESSSTLMVGHHMAWLLGDQGQLVAAESAYQQVLEVRRRVLGPEHPDTLATRHNRAWILRKLRRSGEAKVEYEDLLIAKRSLLGEEHPHTLTTRHNLAIVLCDLGRSVEAEAEYRAVLDVRLRTIGPDSPFTFACRYNLAEVHRDQGDHVTAMSEFSALLQDQQRVLGTEHPDTLFTRQEIAALMARAGNWSEAVTECAEILELREGVLGVEHPDTISTQLLLQKIQQRNLL